MIKGSQKIIGLVLCAIAVLLTAEISSFAATNSNTGECGRVTLRKSKGAVKKSERSCKSAQKKVLKLQGQRKKKADKGFAYLYRINTYLLEWEAECNALEDEALRATCQAKLVKPQDERNEIQWAYDRALEKIDQQIAVVQAYEKNSCDQYVSQANDFVSLQARCAAPQ